MKRRVRPGAEPHVVWNAFVDLLATESYDELSSVQRKAHLVFWYESEVQNGGHGQYLENQGTTQLREAAAALHDLGLPGQGRLLLQIADVLGSAPSPAGWDQLLPGALLDELDRSFHSCSPSVIEALEMHLQTNMSEYVEFA